MMDGRKRFTSRKAVRLTRMVGKRFIIFIRGIVVYAGVSGRVVDKEIRIGKLNITEGKFSAERGKLIQNGIVDDAHICQHIRFGSENDIAETIVAAQLFFRRRGFRHHGGDIALVGQDRLHRPVFPRLHLHLFHCLLRTRKQNKKTKNKKKKYGNSFCVSDASINITSGMKRRARLEGEKQNQRLQNQAEMRNDTLEKKEKNV